MKYDPKSLISVQIHVFDLDSDTKMLHSSFYCIIMRKDFTALESWHSRTRSMFHHNSHEVQAGNMKFELQSTSNVYLYVFDRPMQHFCGCGYET